MEDTGFTLEGRVLCPDDACVGTVGPDRRCKLCGKTYEGPETPVEGPGTPAGTPAGPDAPGEAGPADGAPEAAGAPPDGDGAETDRVCCPDDACVGVIGPDGKCGVCGKTA